MTWTQVQEAGARWADIRARLADARQTIAELEPQEAAAFQALEAAIATFQAAQGPAVAAPKREAKPRVPCANGCGREIGVGTQTNHNKTCGVLHPNADRPS